VGAFIANPRLQGFTAKNIKSDRFSLFVFMAVITIFVLSLYPTIASSFWCLRLNQFKSISCHTQLYKNKKKDVGNISSLIS
jgi:polyferredoxin